MHGKSAVPYCKVQTAKLVKPYYKRTDAEASHAIANDVELWISAQCEARTCSAVPSPVSVKGRARMVDRSSESGPPSFSTHEYVLKWIGMELN
jgi:hypothetical protein